MPVTYRRPTRATVRLDARLVARAKKHAAVSGCTLTALIEVALLNELKGRPASAKRVPIALPIFRGDGLRPGVYLDHACSLIDLMNS